jgi:hypothetical protein
MSLKLITPPEPTQYQFDFKQSSFLIRKRSDIFPMPNSIRRLLSPSGMANTGWPCATEMPGAGERLIVYEDGGYIVAKIEIYKNNQHRTALIKSAW